jgi:hypothetical protein
MGSAAPGSAPQPGGAAPDQSGDMAGAISEIRNIAQSVSALAKSNPALAPQATQITQILRQMIVSAAQQASTQTASSEAVPMGG